ncbi:MAG: penicillin-binding protein 2 [Streptococcaceae bacterium]|jgi:penicillin-binding protein 2B|nr:penicillin-binding protein 2 [Streptococcaceae bacterium]
MKLLKSIRESQKDNGQFKEKKEHTSHIPLRLNILFLGIFVLFVSLIVRLGYMQLINSEYYATQLGSTSNTTVRNSSARGQIFDAQGNVLVGNDMRPSIVFTRDGNTSAQQMRDAAILLTNLVNIQPGDITDRDKRDFFLADRDNFQTVYGRLSDFDKRNEDGSVKTDGEIYQVAVDKVSEEEINFDPQMQAAAFVFKRMNSASAFQSVLITKDNITANDVGIIGENESKLNGITTATDWERKSNITNSIGPIMGRVTTEQQGIPEDQLETLLAKGYARNDRVGVGGLEQTYETYLQGTPSITRLNTDNNGNILSTTQLEQGKIGDSIKLTINMEFQTRVEQIIRDNFNRAVASGAAIYSRGVDVVVMNPNTGAILASVGLNRDPQDGGSILTDAMLPTQRGILPGSTIKGATIASGLENDVITAADNTLIDQPIVTGGVTKASFFNPDGRDNATLNIISALYRSSNSYMMQLAIRMLGQEYSPNMVMNWSNREKVFNQLHSTFADFGLGIQTGVDIPNETTAQTQFNIDSDEFMGNLLDYSFGQFFNYSALQIASYASTIATGGTRFVPHFVQGIYASKPNGQLGDRIKEIGPTVGSNVKITPEAMSLIQQGFYETVHNAGGTGIRLRNSKMDMAAKTGTAEMSEFGQSLVNSNVAAYAPASNPTVAIGLMFGGLTFEDGHFSNYHSDMVNQIMDAYYEMFASKGITP